MQTGPGKHWLDSSLSSVQVVCSAKQRVQDKHSQVLALREVADMCAGGAGEAVRIAAHMVGTNPCPLPGTEGFAMFSVCGFF